MPATLASPTYKVKDRADAVLNGVPISAGATSLEVTAGQGIRFPADTFCIWLENERVFVGTRTGDVFSGLQRGYGGTAPASHASGAYLFQEFGEATYDRLVEDLVNHTHDAADIAVGIVAPARLGSGTPDATTFLRGDSTYAVPVGGGGGPAFARLTADRTNSTTTLADATGLSFSVAANSRYLFEFYVIFQTAATTTGFAVAVNGPSGATVVLQREVPTGLNAVTHGAARAYNSGAAAASIDAANANTLAILRGLLVTAGTAGTLIVRFASEVASSLVTVKAESTGVLWTIP